MVLLTKPKANNWLHLTPRVAALGMDAFERGPPLMAKINAQLVRELNLAESEGEKSAGCARRHSRHSRQGRCEEQKVLRGQILEWLEAEWIASIVAKTYPEFSLYLIRVFLNGTNYRSHPDTVCDVWIRQFQ